MALAAHEKKGIFCLEGEWSEDLRKTSSVQPLLELLRQDMSYAIPSVRRDVGTVAELQFYLTKWVQRKYDRFPILYLALHGDPGVIYLAGERGARTSVSLSQLADPLCGRCDGRIIVFATCGTVGVHGNSLNRFLRRTGALAICGYKVDVGWIEATAFELLLLSALQDNAFTVSGARAVLRRIRKLTPYLVRQLHFRMVIRGAR